MKFEKNEIDVVNHMQSKNPLSLLYQLVRITNPFLFISEIIKFRPKKRIYIISSEFTFIPVIGGINTFLRVILSELMQSKIHIDKNVEFVFIGIEVGNSFPMPQIQGVFYKFFPTENSQNHNSLEEYFKSFGKYSELAKDLQNFGKSSMNWIEKDSIPGDILVPTIVYELNKKSLENLNKKGVQIVHTVHSLVPLKIINNLKTTSLSGLSFKERIFFFLIY